MAGAEWSASAEAYALASEIAHCPVMVECLQGAKYDCSEVVLAQWPKGYEPAKRLVEWPKRHGLPAPWVGDIEHAKILFLGSNPFGARLKSLPDSAVLPDDLEEREKLYHPYEMPSELKAVASKHPSVNRKFASPKWQWSYAEVFDKYGYQFDIWVEEDGSTLRVPPAQKPGSPRKTWEAAKRHASQILQKDVKPGRDYAMTDVVHCRSENEAGVKTASKECVPRYLERVLGLSPAPLIVVYGDKARNLVRSVLSYKDEGVFPPRCIDVGGRRRRIVFLAHPASTDPRRPKDLTPEQLDDAYAWINAGALS